MKLINLRQKILRVPINVAQLRPLRALEWTRRMNRLGGERREVGGLEREGLVADEPTARERERWREIPCQILPRKQLQRIRRIARRAKNIAMIAPNKIRHVVHPSCDRHPKVVVPRMLRHFSRVPRLVQVGAQESTEDDDVEQDEPAAEGDEQADRDFLAPRQAYIGTLHAADGRK